MLVTLFFNKRFHQNQAGDKIALWRPFLDGDILIVDDESLLDISDINYLFSRLDFRIILSLLVPFRRILFVTDGSSFNL
jgi:hypothetical protein